MHLVCKQSFFMSFDERCNGKNSFHSHLMNMSEYFNLPDFSPDLLDTAMHGKKLCISSMKQEHSQKREFYRSFKNKGKTCLPPSMLSSSSIVHV